MKNVTRFEEINWNGFKRIGNGAYGMVFVKGHYAIKVGQVYHREYESKLEARQHRLVPPVYGYFPSVPFSQLPDFIQAELRSEWDWRYSGSAARVDILIQGRAKPATGPDFYENDDFYRSEISRLSKFMWELRSRASNAGIDWLDNHIGNAGTYRGKPVILDGLA